MNKDIFGSLFAVVICFAAGTLLVFQPVWFWRALYKDSGYGKDHSRQREADLRLLREDHPEFTRRFFGMVLFLRFMGIIWYMGFFMFLITLLEHLFPA